MTAITSAPLTDELRERLISAALEASVHAYAPHSHYPVGAALLTEDGEILTGCNIETANWNSGICAERCAIFAAVAARGSFRIRAIAAFTRNRAPGPPCGACRQVISEWGPDASVLYQGHNGVLECSIRELLPDAFSGEDVDRGHV